MKAAWRISDVAVLPPLHPPCQRHRLEKAESFRHFSRAAREAPRGALQFATEIERQAGTPAILRLREPRTPSTVC
jgi:hypothetical protein